MLRTSAGARLAAVALLSPFAFESADALPRTHWAGESPRCKLLGEEAIRDPSDPFAQLRARTEPANGLRGTFAGCPHDYDVLHYDLQFSDIDPAVQTFSGVTEVTFESQVDALGSIHLDLTSQLIVAGVTDGGGLPLAFTHAADSLQVTFTTPPDSGDTASVTVAYSGMPANEGSGGFGGFWFAQFPLSAYSMGVGLNADPPSQGRSWFPGYDWPCDKATVSLSATVAQDEWVVSNGLLTGVDSTATDHTLHWEHDYPISTYLIAMAMAKYKALSDTVVTDPRITVYHHPGYKKRSEVSFRNVDLMMEAMETRLGSYPFDKFAYMTTPKGDMEHQTCVSHALGLVDSTNTYDDILAHEMMHMWFGDCVTYGDWRDVWLSEGFATYGEALFREYAYGSANYHAYVTSSIFGRVLASGQTDGVYDPTFKWGAVAYEKGGSVLHMLRGILDDDALFWQVLRDYHTNFAYGNAVTTDFLASVNASVGEDLSWFFTPWVYGDGHPVYEYGWSSEDLGGGQWRVEVGIDQIQTTGSLFDLPVDFRVQTASGDFDFSERIDQASQLVSFVVPAEPTGLEIDPDDWILDVQMLAPTSVDFGAGAAAQALQLLPPRPNPMANHAELRFFVPSAGRVQVEIYDVAGRRVRTLLDALEQPGPRSVWWDRRDETGRRVAGGVYWARVEVQGEQRSVKVVVAD